LVLVGRSGGAPLLELELAAAVPGAAVAEGSTALPGIEGGFPARAQKLFQSKAGSPLTFSLANHWGSPAGVGPQNHFCRFFGSSLSRVPGQHHGSAQQGARMLSPAWRASMADACPA